MSGVTNVMSAMKMAMPMNTMPMTGGMITIGSKAQVFHGTAHHTSGGLTRKELFQNKRGKIVSRKQAAAGKKAYSRLVKAGYKPKKGTFKLFTKKGSKKTAKKATRKGRKASRKAGRKFF
jgi:hypothetical protein